MIISHQHHFIFLKTRKTAGTSIEIVLSRFAGDDAIVTPITPSEPGHRPRNYVALEKPWEEQVLGDERWNSAFKFCFERNPWDKVATLYGWQTRNPRDTRPFLKWLFDDPRVSSDWPIYSIDGECAVDAIGRYESLHSDLRTLAQRAGVLSDDIVELPRSKSGFRKEVRYSSAGVDYIRHVFHREIELFGYECPPDLEGSQ